MAALPRSDTVVLGGGTYARLGSSSSLPPSEKPGSSTVAPVAPLDPFYEQIKGTVEWMRSSLPGTPKERAQQQACWSRLDTNKQNLLVKAFEHAEAIQEHLRMWTGNKEFLVTYQAKHALCRPGPSVRATLLQLPGMTAARLDQEPDHRNVGQRHFTALGMGKFGALQKFVWGDLLTGMTSLKGCGVLDNLTISATQVAELKSWFNHFHVTWDLPDSTTPSRFIHDGATIIYVINAHCANCHVTPFGNLTGLFRYLDGIRKPSSPPIEISGDISYIGAPHRPCAALDIEPDDLEAFQKLSL